VRARLHRSRADCRAAGDAGADDVEAYVALDADVSDLLHSVGRVDCRVGGCANEIVGSRRAGIGQSRVVAVLDGGGKRSVRPRTYIQKEGQPLKPLRVDDVTVGGRIAGDGRSIKGHAGRHPACAIELHIRDFLCLSRGWLPTPNPR
jgi:hypothetical protein